jgi:hypothetical protein
MLVTQRQKMKDRYPRQNSRKQHAEGRRTVATSVIRQMPMIRTQFVQTVRRRFQANGGVSSNLTLSAVLNQFLIATTSTNLVPSIDSIRLKRIEAWSNQSTTSNTGEGQINITNIGSNDISSNNFNSVPWEISDITNSGTYTAHVERNFPFTDPCGSWHSAYSNVNTSQSLFTIGMSPSSTIDMWFEIVIPFGFLATSSYAITVSGASPGNYYARIPMSNLTPFQVNVI